MTATARKVLADFDTLPTEDQQQVFAELLRRRTQEGELPEAALDELADELFRDYDTQEAERDHL